MEDGAAPVLSASQTGNIPLDFTTADQEAVKLSWTNPNYQFTTGVSSHSVTYQIEIDTAGANFSNPQKQTINVNRDVNRAFTQSVFNDYLLNQLVLKPGVSHDIEIRVKAFLENNSALLVSNVLQFTVTPYAIPPKVPPPASGKLFITASATPASWQCGCGEAELLLQKFTQVTPTLYVLDRITLTRGGSYLLLLKFSSITESLLIYFNANKNAGLFHPALAKKNYSVLLLQNAEANFQKEI